METEIRDKYYNYLKYELNYSDNTILDYFKHLDNYVEYLLGKNYDYKGITKERIYDYLRYLDKKHLSNRTIANILSSLRNFYDFLLDEKIIEFNMFKLIKNPKLDKKLPNFLSYEEMMKIFDDMPSETELDMRNKMIVEVLYATGIRVSELVNMKISDIDFNELTIRIFGKGKKERIVYFSNHARSAMKLYLDNRAFASEYLVLNKNGKKITTRSIEKIIEKIALTCSINHNVSPHTFRHTFATHLLNGGADIKSVGELLGHSSLDTTEIYTHITSDYLKSEYLKNMPRR